MSEVLESWAAVGRRVLRLVPAIIAIVAGASPASQAAAQNGVLPTGASAEHAWFAAPGGEPDGWRLFHHALSMEGPFYRTPQSLPIEPEAIAASGSQAWLVFRERSAAGWQRSVFTLNASRNPATGLFFYVPPDSLTLAQSLPADGELVAFVGTEHGPVALLVPPMWSDVGIEVPGNQSPRTAAAPRLLELRQNEWVEIELPEVEAGWRFSGLGAASSDEFVVIASRDRPSQRAAVFERIAGEWRRHDLPGNAGFAGQPILLSAQSRTVVAAVERGGDRIATAVNLHVLRRGRLISLGRHEFGGDAIAIVGLRDGVHIFSVDAAGAITRRIIDTTTGAVSDPVAMANQPLASASRLYVPLIVVGLALGLMLVVLLRPVSDSERVTLPPSLRLADLGRRGVALLLDVAPSAGVAMAVSGVSLIDLFAVPLWTSDSGHALAIVLAAVLTALHCLVAEAIWCASFGKALMGLRVATVTGGRCRLWQIAVRNVMKAITLIVPLLAIFLLLNASRQRLGDVLARTVVVEETGLHHPPQPPGDEPS